MFSRHWGRSFEKVEKERFFFFSNLKVVEIDNWKKGDAGNKNK